MEHTITNFVRFKAYNSEWSKWYDVCSSDFKMITKHLNWSNVEAIEVKQ